MKQCSLNHFTESLAPWLNEQYVHKVVLTNSGQVVFTFRDGVSDTYEITDCGKKQVKKICKELADSGIPVQGLD
ncbi:MAG TPA: hypothetical protein ENK84_08385 [Desulfobulbus sp.]|nr:hypothetical protein [Desulfobulbus sp.]HHD64705.1 hypothetical protein [Desulfobulbaceae bacterium]